MRNKFVIVKNMGTNQYHKSELIAIQNKKMWKNEHETKSYLQIWEAKFETKMNMRNGGKGGDLMPIANRWYVSGERMIKIAITEAQIIDSEKLGIKKIF